MNAEATERLVNGRGADETVEGNLKLAPDMIARLRCPMCGAAIIIRDGQGHCANPVCHAEYPVIDGTPILINERNSVFTLDEFVRQDETFFIGRGKLERFLEERLPDVSRNIGTEDHYDTFARALLAKRGTPTVLVLGGGILGKGIQRLLSYRSIRLIESDVALAPRTILVCDAHDIPFDDGVFDGVIVQAVLEHVADPYRCVDEIHRVLKPDGLVYAETPFMQQVHGGKYDFTRFTHLGHRRLFHSFNEIESGAVCGPGMALAWSNLYFLLSFTNKKMVRKVIRLIARLLFFPLTYVDSYLIDKPAALDAASGFYFLGRKSDCSLSDQALLALYRGAV